MRVTSPQGVTSHTSLIFDQRRFLCLILNQDLPWLYWISKRPTVIPSGQGNTVARCVCVVCSYSEKKIKCTLVQTLRLCTGRTACRGSRGIALLLHGHGTRRGSGVCVTPRPLFTPGKDPVPIVQEAGWAPGPVWTGAENLAPTGIRSPYRPDRS